MNRLRRKQEDLSYLLVPKEYEALIRQRVEVAADLLTARTVNVVPKPQKDPTAKNKP